LLGYLVSSQNTGVCCCPACCETFVYWWSALAASQTRDWTTLADPCLLLSFFMLLCPVQPRRILLDMACLVLSCFALTSPMYRPQCIAASGSNSSNPRSWACLLSHPIGTSSVALARVCPTAVHTAGERRSRGSAGGRFVLL
jgi:hypothetical protein